MPRAGNRNATVAPRLSLTPRSLHAASEASLYNDDQSTAGSFGPRPHDFARASTLANLRTQPQPMRYAEPRQPAIDTISFHIPTSRYDVFQPQLQQPTPPFHLGWCSIPFASCMTDHEQREQSIHHQVKEVLPPPSPSPARPEGLLRTGRHA